VGHLVQQYGYLAVIGFVGLESLGIPLPGETALVAAAVYAGFTHRLSIELVILSAIAGAVLGDAIGFAIGYFGGWPLLARYGRYIRLHDDRIRLLRYIFFRHGGKVVFFGRFVSVLRTYAALLAGTTRMAWRRFLVFNAAGGIAWAILYGSVAYGLGHELDRLSRPFEIAVGVAASTTIVLGFLFVRYNEKRLEAEARRIFPGPQSH
jgi:membrane protein DedA with SNARE-associated domain